jgi:hypothetical protein
MQEKWWGRERGNLKAGAGIKMGKKNPLSHFQSTIRIPIFLSIQKTLPPCVACNVGLRGYKLCIYSNGSKISLCRLYLLVGSFSQNLHGYTSFGWVPDPIRLNHEWYHSILLGFQVPPLRGFTQPKNASRYDPAFRHQGRSCFFLDANRQSVKACFIAKQRASFSSLWIETDALRRSHILLPGPLSRSLTIFEVWAKLSTKQTCSSHEECAFWNSTTLASSAWPRTYY